MASSVGAPLSATGPAGDEKHNSTTTSTQSTEAREHLTSLVPDAAPVLGAGGIVGEDSGRAEEAANAFIEHELPDSANYDEKHRGKVTHGVNESAAGTDVPAVTGERSKEEGAVTEEEEDDDENIVYPKKMQLWLLTLGLCLATFTVALGEWFSYPF